MYETTLCLATN